MARQPSRGRIRLRVVVKARDRTLSQIVRELIRIVPDNDQAQVEHIVLPPVVLDVDAPSVIEPEIVPIAYIETRHWSHRIGA